MTTIQRTVHLTTGNRTEQQLRDGPKPKPVTTRIPRISKLVALALFYDALLEDGAVKDYAELATLGQVSRARITQIMKLRWLAPDIIEELLFLPRLRKSQPDVLTLKRLGSIVKHQNWQHQRAAWKQLKPDLT